MIHERAQPRGWPQDLASDYLKQRIVYAFTEEIRDGLELFHRKACDRGLIETIRPLEILSL